MTVMLDPQKMLLLAARRRWTPARLGGVLSYYLVKLGYVWQDVARTTPAVNVGDPVACLDDQSGKGRHLTQATASSRPTLQKVGGVWCLTFDGVDDTLTRTGMVTFGLNGISWVVAASLSAAGSYPVFMVAAGIYAELRGSSTTARPEINYNITLATSPTALTIGTKYTLGGRTGPTLTDIRVGGVQKAAAGGFGTAVNQNQMAMGSRGDGSLFLPGSVFGAVGADAQLSDGDITQAENWLTQQTS